MEGVIDRIENGTAVILVEDGGEMYLPVHKLPAGVKEGNVLRFDVTLDKNEEQERKKRVEDLQKRLRSD